MQTLLSPCLLCVWYHRVSFFFLMQDYPKNRHPGWSRGSVAYHAGEQGLPWGNGGCRGRRGTGTYVSDPSQVASLQHLAGETFPCTIYLPPRASSAFSSSVFALKARGAEQGRVLGPNWTFQASELAASVPFLQILRFFFGRLHFL